MPDKGAGQRVPGARSRVPRQGGIFASLRPGMDKVQNSEFRFQNSDFRIQHSDFSIPMPAFK